MSKNKTTHDKKRKWSETKSKILADCLRLFRNELKTREYANAAIDADALLPDVSIERLLKIAGKITSKEQLVRQWTWALVFQGAKFVLDLLDLIEATSVDDSEHVEQTARHIMIPYMREHYGDADRVINPLRKARRDQ